MIPQPGVGDEKQVLEKYVSFYRKLDRSEKEEFVDRLRYFLANTRITAVNTRLENEDLVLIGAAAVIPIFGFKHWEYRNIEEVLVYPEAFNHDFEQSGGNRNILGMVGNGPMQHVMILSKAELRNGFEFPGNRSNPAVHEFVHLVDKEDGSTDGLPEVFLPPQYAEPWLKMMHKEIEKIREGRSDINPYGATNEAEFLAVAAEYFFSQPKEFEQHHPELYQLMQEAFHTGAKDPKKKK